MKQWLRVAFAMFTVAWGGNQYTPMLVFYKTQGFFSTFFIDLMLVSYAVGVAVGLLAAGPASDSFGRKKVMLPTPLMAAVASALIAAGQHNAALMTLGRFGAGVAVGIAMTAGGAWVKELSARRFDPTSTIHSGAKRAALALTAGFALGPAAAGLLAQFVPAPGVVPYLLHICLSVVGMIVLFPVPETRESKVTATRPRGIPSLRSSRFWLVVAPMAPWVFGAGFTAYAILPPIVAGLTPYPIVMTAAIALLTLGSGFAIQQIGPAIAGESTVRGPATALIFVIIGMSLATAVVVRPSLWLLALACVFLGCAYGLAAYVGLAETQDIATPADMAGLVGIFYCLTYIGMLFPATLNKMSGWFTYPQMLLFGVVVATVTLMGLFRRR